MKLKKYAKAFWRLLTNRDYRFRFNASKGRYGKLTDEEYLKRMFKASVGYDLNLGSPKTFNEKLQWLKLYDRDPKYTAMVDKHLVKNYVANLIGEQYIIPTLAVYNSAEEIDFSSLPNRFVLKCNHNSGLGMYICKDKKSLSPKAIRKIKSNLQKGLSQDYYLYGREWPYKNVQRKIIAEQYMEDDKADGLMDYKFFCFNGSVYCTMVCTDRFNGNGLKVTFFDRDWNKLPLRRHYPSSEKKIMKPINYEKMIELAEKLSAGIPFLRVDFYEINGRIYLGELTFFPGGGFEEFDPTEKDLELGDLIKLPHFKQ